MITKLNKGWRNALMLCAAAVVTVLVSSCRAPASETGRYQWNIVPGGEGRSDQIYVTDMFTGEMAYWDQIGKKWSPSYTSPGLLPDWNAIREEKRAQVKQWAKEKKQKEEAREKHDALVKSYSRLPLEKQVAWAKNIIIYKYRGKRFDTIDLERFTTLKGKPAPDENRWPYKATDDGLAVWFDGMVEGNPLNFCLSRTPFDSEGFFPAPATIIDDVKAEIKRQEEKKKEAHAENH
jgi:hypothetical protein